MPRIFLEDYSTLKNMLINFIGQNTSSIIFTSQAHFTDEVFKSWTASKCSSGTSLIIGEHGGLGVGKFNGAHRYEVSIADTYLSTGWTSNNQSNIVPIGHFRAKYLNSSTLSSSKALLICGNMPRYSFDIRSMVLSSQTLDYFDDQFILLDSLPPTSRMTYLFGFIPMTTVGIKKIDGLIDILMYVLPIALPLSSNILQSAVLFICTYNATTYIDCLTSNYPTVIFWNPDRWESKPEAIDYFELLHRCGIFHTSPVDAAIHIQNIWDDVPSWWCSPDVQSARISFCNAFSRSHSDIEHRFSHIMRGPSDLPDFTN